MSGEPDGLPTAHLFGVDVAALDRAATLDRVFELVEDPRPTQHVVLNAAKVVAMQRDDRLRRIVADCGLVNADGASVVWASRLLGDPLPERVTGIDLFEAIVDRAAVTGHSVYLLGATDEVLAAATRRLLDRHPGLHVVGTRNGYWDDGDPAAVAEVVDGVREAAPDLLFVALPSPRKEFWLHDHAEALGVPFVMGVGGTFDVVAGTVRRAPQWAQRAGLEWAFRLAQEPRRMWRRYLVGNTRFVAITAAAWWRRRRPPTPSVVEAGGGALP